MLYYQVLSTKYTHIHPLIGTLNSLKQQFQNQAIQDIPLFRIPILKHIQSDPEAEIEVIISRIQKMNFNKIGQDDQIGSLLQKMLPEI